MSVKDENIQGNLSVSRGVTAGGDLTVHGNAEFGHNVVVKGWLDARNVKGPCKGLYASAEALSAAYPSPMPGWYALVGDTLPADVYRADGGKWVATGEKGGETNLYLDDLEEEVSSLEGAVGALEGDVSSLEAAVGTLEDVQKRHGEILKGTPDYIDNGFNYPFVQLGNFATYESLRAELDALHSVDPSSKVTGYFRATLNGIGMELKSYVTSWAEEAFVQALSGALHLNADDSFSTANEYGTFVRRYSGGSWTKWASATAGLEAAVSGLEGMHALGGLDETIADADYFGIYFTKNLGGEPQDEPEEVRIPAATQEAAGVMSAADKAKLDGLGSAATQAKDGLMSAADKKKLDKMDPGELALLDDVDSVDFVPLGIEVSGSAGSTVVGGTGCPMVEVTLRYDKGGAEKSVKGSGAVKVPNAVAPTGSLSPGQAGLMSAADKAKLDKLGSSATLAGLDETVAERDTFDVYFVKCVGGEPQDATERVSIQSATQDSAGVMSAADKAKLDGLGNVSVECARTTAADYGMSAWSSVLMRPDAYDFDGTEYFQLVAASAIGCSVGTLLWAWGDWVVSQGQLKSQNAGVRQLIVSRSADNVAGLQPGDMVTFDCSSDLTAHESCVAARKQGNTFVVESEGVFAVDVPRETYFRSIRLETADGTYTVTFSPADGESLSVEIPSSRRLADAAVQESHSSRLDALEEALAAAGSTDIADRVETLEAAVAIHQGDITDINGRLAAAEGAVAGVRSELEGLRGGMMDELRGYVDGLDSSKAMSEEDIDKAISPPEGG